MITDVSAVEERGGSLRGSAVAAVGSALAALRSSAPVAQVVRFAWHYVQMAIAMELGMFLPVGFILSALGLSDLVSRSHEASALLMTAEMVLGMAAWMRIRRHPWRHTVEMSAGMSASTVVAAAASLAGLLPHTAVNSGTVGILMWAGMLGAMLFRWRDYAQGHHGHAAQKKAAA
jgi:flagellar biosynthetic protein FliP